MIPKDGSLTGHLIQSKEEGSHNQIQQQHHHQHHHLQQQQQQQRERLRKDDLSSHRPKIIKDNRRWGRVIAMPIIVILCWMQVGIESQSLRKFGSISSSSSSSTASMYIHIASSERQKITSFSTNQTTEDDVSALIPSTQSSVPKVVNSADLLPKNYQIKEFLSFPLNTRQDVVIFPNYSMYDYHPNNFVYDDDDGDDHNKNNNPTYPISTLIEEIKQYFSSLKRTHSTTSIDETGKVDNYNNGGRIDKNDNDNDDLDWILDYVIWHYEQRVLFPDSQLLTNNTHGPKILIVYMDPNRAKAGGLTDRLRSIGHVLRLVAKSSISRRRLVLIKWYESPTDLEEFLVPNFINWTLPIVDGISTTAELLTQNYQHYPPPKTLEKGNATRILLIKGNNNLGSYHPPFGVLWNVLFRPSPRVALSLQETIDKWSLIPGRYHTIHFRLGHPAYNNQVELKNKQIDLKGYNFKGVNKVKALKTALHALECCGWMIEDHFKPNDRNNPGKQQTPSVSPIYIYSDSSHLVNSILDIYERTMETTVNTSMEGVTRTTAAAATTATTTTIFSEIESQLEDWMRNRSALSPKTGTLIAGRRTAEHVVHINAPGKDDTSLDAFASTFVDLYIASHANCIAMGVGRFAYLASKLSATTCTIRYETTTSSSVSSRWGMTHMIQEIPACPI